MSITFIWGKEFHGVVVAKLKVQLPRERRRETGVGNREQDPSQWSRKSGLGSGDGRNLGEVGTCK